MITRTDRAVAGGCFGALSALLVEPFWRALLVAIILCVMSVALFKGEPT